MANKSKLAYLFQKRNLISDHFYHFIIDCMLHFNSKLFATKFWLVTWHSGRTSVCDRRTFPIVLPAADGWPL